MGGLDCHYCARRLLDLKVDTFRRSKLSATRDHVLPKCLGGRKTVWACRQCNNLKGDLTPEQWSKVMATFPIWWKRFKTTAEIRTELVALARITKARRMKRGYSFRVAGPPLCRGLAPAISTPAAAGKAA